MHLSSISALVAALCVGSASAGPSEVVLLNDANWEEQIGSHEFMMVAFGASWCPYSRQLEPIWDSAAKTYESMGSDLSFLLSAFSASVFVRLYVCFPLFVQFLSQMGAWIGRHK